MRWRQSCGLVVLFLILIGTLAHICALPLHAPAAAQAGDNAEDHHGAVPARDHDDGSGEDALHTASCEAILASAVTVAPALVSAIAPAAVASERRPRSMLQRLTDVLIRAAP